MDDTSYNILIVEDEFDMLEGLKDNLEVEGYLAEGVINGNEALKKIAENTYHLIVLDVMLPDISGFDICKKLRKQGVSIPVIMLTAKAEEVDKVLGLEIGADDYITKPFSLRELLARIKAVLRRNTTEQSRTANGKAHGEILIGKLQVNFDNYSASSGESQVRMTYREIELLRYLWNQRNVAVSREELMENVWGYNIDISTRTIDNFIRKVRQKVESTPEEPSVIITVHGYGYKLIA